MHPHRRVSIVGLLLLLAPLAACDDSTGPAAPSALEIVSGDGQEGTVAATLDAPLVVRVVDGSGNGISGVSVSWEVESGDGSVSVLDEESGSDGRAEAEWTLGPEVGTQTLTVMVEGVAPATFEAEAVAAVPADVEASSDATPEGTVGEELDAPVAVRVTDAFGNPTPGVAVSWSVTEGDGTVDPADATTGADGLATTQWTLGTTAGSEHELRAEIEELDPVTFRAEAAAGPLAEVLVTPSEPSVEAGESVELEASLQDAYGNELPDRPVSWESDLEEVATVTAEGVVETSAPGPVEVRANVDDLTGTATVTVLASFPPVMSGVEPTTLTAGETATITGNGFSPVPDFNRVRIDGVQAEVLAATGTELQVQVPPPSAFPCRETEQVSLELTVPDLSTASLRSLSVAERVSLSPGESMVLADTETARCSEIIRTTNNATYLFSVFDRSDEPTDTTVFRLQGEGLGSESAPSFARLTTGETLSSLAAAPGRTNSGFGSDAPSGSARLDLLDRSRDLYRRLVTSGARPGTASTATAAERTGGAWTVGAGASASTEAPSSGAATSSSGPSAAADPPSVGEVLSLRVPGPDDLCGDYVQVEARVAYSGDRAVVLEDLAAPLATQMDARYEDVGEEFEDTMFPILETYFGDPLAMDEALDGTGQIYMLFTPVLNDRAGITGFVNSGDFFAREDCAASDERSIFYAQVPETAAEVSDWYWEIRATVMKESKHLTSIAERMSRDAAALEETWLEEATGRIAEELYARDVFGYGQGDNTTYSQSIACERNCSGEPRVMLEHFGELYDYLEAPHTFSVLGPTSEGETTFSSSAWLFVRWALDHYGGPEADFLQTLVQDGSRTGLDNLEARTGRDFGDMLGTWTLSIVMDEQDPEDPALTHPSWDLRDIYSGLNQNLPQSFPAEFPLAGWQFNYGEFDQAFEVQGGSAAFFSLVGQSQGQQLLELLALDGGDAPSNLGLAIVRVQ